MILKVQAVTPSPLGMPCRLCRKRIDKNFPGREITLVLDVDGKVSLVKLDICLECINFAYGKDKDVSMGSSVVPEKQPKQKRSKNAKNASSRKHDI